MNKLSEVLGSSHHQVYTSPYLAAAFVILCGGGSEGASELDCYCVIPIAQWLSRVP